MNKSRRLFLKGSILGTAAAPLLPFIPDKVLALVDRYQLRRLCRPLNRTSRELEKMSAAFQESEIVAARMTAAINCAVGDLVAMKDEGSVLVYDPESGPGPIGIVNRVIDDETVEVDLTLSRYDGRELFED